jgi:hypothetical protein
MSNGTFCKGGEFKHLLLVSGVEGFEEEVLVLVRVANVGEVLVLCLPDNGRSLTDSE